MDVVLGNVTPSLASATSALSVGEKENKAATQIRASRVRKIQMGVFVRLEHLQSGLDGDRQTRSLMMNSNGEFNGSLKNRFGVS